jgi:N-methylhydantoinase A
VTFNATPHDTPIYWRDHLPEDVNLTGPAIIEQLDSTIIIPPCDRVTGGADGNLIIHIGADT